MESVSLQFHRTTNLLDTALLHYQMEFKFIQNRIGMVRGEYHGLHSRMKTSYSTLDILCPANNDHTACWEIKKDIQITTYQRELYQK